MQENSNEFQVCRKCGYGRGFHVYFKDIHGRKTKICLICPSCGQSYDIGWVTSEIKGSDIKDGKIFGE